MNQQNLADFIWNVADALRGPFKPSLYGRIILPFTVLRRLDSVPSAAVLAIIEAALAARLNNFLAGVIDDLILAGQSAVTGNAPADTPTPA
jgi:type I restriction enzyme M protein